MKPAHIGLLILLAMAALGVFVVLRLVPDPIPAVIAPTGSTKSTKSTRSPERPPQPETKATARKSTSAPGKSTSGRGVFSGSDPADPRIYH
jgi:hypothetical protein